MKGFQIETGFADAMRPAAASLYWEAFSAKLGKVMGPEQHATAFFARTMSPTFALTATAADGTLLGLAGFKTAEGSLTGGEMRDLQHVYGWFGGLWRGLILSTLERDLEPGVLLMDGICVAPQARGQGVGTALLRAIKEHAAAKGLRAVRLDVIDSNPRAKALYEREGFRPLGTTKTGPLRHLFGFRSALAMQCDVLAPRR